MAEPLLCHRSMHQIPKRLCALLAVVLSAVNLACGGSPSGPSGTGGLTLRLDSATASVLAVDMFATVAYQSCFAILGRATRPVTIQSVRYEIFLPDGSPSIPIVGGAGDSLLSGQTIGGTAGDYTGCRYMYADSALNRAVATTYRITVYYTFDAASVDDPQTVTATGSVVSTLPPGTFMTGVTISGPQVLQRPVDATFTAAGSGGVAPYQFRWMMGSSVLREWDTSPTFVWDGTINGQPVAAGSRTLQVYARSNGRNFVEASGNIPLVVQ